MTDSILRRLGTSLKQMHEKPDLFYNMLVNMNQLPPSLANSVCERSLLVRRSLSDSTTYERITLGGLVEFFSTPDAPTGQVGVVVGCLPPNTALGRSQDVFLIVDCGALPAGDVIPRSLEPAQPVQICIIQGSDVRVGRFASNSPKNGGDTTTARRPGPDSDAMDRVSIDHQRGSTAGNLDQDALDFHFLGISKSAIVEINPANDQVRPLLPQATTDNGEQTWVSVSFCTKNQMVAAVDAHDSLIVFHAPDGAVRHSSVLTYSFNAVPQASHTRPTAHEIKKLSYGDGYLMDGNEETLLYVLVKDTCGDKFCFTIAWMDTFTGNVIPLLKLPPQVHVISFAVVPFFKKSLYAHNGEDISEPSFVILIEDKGLFVVNSDLFKELKLSSPDHLLVSQVQDVGFSKSGDLFLTTFRSLAHVESSGRVVKVKYLGSTVLSLSPFDKRSDGTVFNLDRLLHRSNLTVGVTGGGEAREEAPPSSGETPLRSEDNSSLSPSMTRLLGNLLPKFSRKAMQSAESRSHPDLSSEIEGITASTMLDPTMQGSVEEHYTSDRCRSAVEELLSISNHGGGGGAPTNTTETPQTVTTPVASQQPRHNHGNYEQNEAFATPKYGSPPPEEPKVETPLKRHADPNGDIASFLRGLGLEQYIPNFEAEDLTDMDLLRSLTKSTDFKDTLREIGVCKVGHRAKITQALIG